jgi:phage terminase large subunit-like protein
MSGHVLPYLRLESGERWCDVATPEQRADVDALLAGEQRYHWWGRPRGGSKTTDGGIAGVELLVLAPPGSRSYCFGSDRDQAALIIDVLTGVIRRNPALAEVFDVRAWKVTVRATGASLEAVAADAFGAWGLRPHFVFVDELAQWPTTRGALRLWEAISTALPKTGGRMVVATTAGDPAHWSHKIREHALGDPLWRVSDHHGAPAWMDQALIEEARRRLPESSYRRLFLNEWVSGEDRLVAEEDLAAAVVLDGPQEPQLGKRYTLGLDIGLKRDRTAAAICHLEDGVVTLDRIETWEGSRLRPVSLADLEEWLVRATASYRAHVVADPWQGALLIERLRRRSVKIDEFPFTSQSVGRIASTLYQVLRERALRLPDDEALLDELRNVRLRETSPGVVRLDHDSGHHDDRAVALALAVHRLVEKGEARGPRGSWVAHDEIPGIAELAVGSNVAGY